MSETLLCYAFSAGAAIVAGILFATWLKKKANMTPKQGMNLFAASLPGMLLVLGASAWTGNIPCWLLLGCSVAAALASAVIFVLFRFFRDPERVAPAGPNLLLSPADGRVLYIREASDGIIPEAIKGRNKMRIDELAGTPLTFTDAWIIGIGMTLLDVHVNRAPCAGTIVASVHTPGSFLSLKDPASLTINERNTITFEMEKGSMVAMVQIASKQVRRIRSFVTAGQSVSSAQRVGSILFGSQVDLILPRAGIKIRIEEGQQLTAGETIVAVTE